MPVVLNGGPYGRVYLGPHEHALAAILVGQGLPAIDVGNHLCQFVKSEDHVRSLLERASAEGPSALHSGVASLPAA